MSTAVRIAAQNSPNWAYPALTDEEVSDPVIMASNYRAALARERRYWIVGGVLATVLLFDFVRYGPRKRR